MNKEKQVLKSDIHKWRETQRQSVLRYIQKLRSQPKHQAKQRISKLTGLPIISRQKAEKHLWEAFSLHIRKRDKTCVLAHLGGCWGYLQAGHVVGRGRKATKYAEDNVFAQCQAHNKLHRYYPEVYYAWYVKKFGGKKFNELVRRSRVDTKSIPTAEALRLTKHYQQILINS